MVLLFLFVAFISFAGSLHPGTVNLAVIQATLTQNRRTGIWLALGGSLPEFGYGALAAGGLMALPVSSWTHWLSWASLPVLLGAGWAAFRQKPVSADSNLIKGKAPFWTGITLALTNPQLLPFWSVVWLSLQQNRFVTVEGKASLWVFASGTAVGAFVLLLTLVGLADWQRGRIGLFLQSRWLNYLMGATFLGLALWQLAQLLGLLPL